MDALVAVKRTLLWLGEGDAPANVQGAAGDEWILTPGKPDLPLDRQLNNATLVAICPGSKVEDSLWFDNLLKELDRTSAVGIFLLPKEAKFAWSMLSRRRGHFLYVSEDATAEELAARFATAGAIQPGISKLQVELSASRGLNGGGGGGGAERLDEEMRLAARLQRDFLPDRLPEVGRVKFSVLYRPAGWVSGDIYDVVRLDETNVGFYVVDVVGHGMPAALLTMFVKKALQTKRIEGNTYEIIPPHDSLTALNIDICEQNLSSCQFCTAVYCVVDTAAMKMTYARAGHPEPIIMRAGGKVEFGALPGSLLGIFPEEQFQSRQIDLSAGDRLLVYSDGAEDALFGGVDCTKDGLRSAAGGWSGVGRAEMLAEISARIDADRKANGVEDDITIIVMDVE